jgi:hypothetical protein
MRLDGPKSLYRCSREELNPCACWELNHFYPIVNQFFAKKKNGKFHLVKYHEGIEEARGTALLSF